MREPGGIEDWSRKLERAYGELRAVYARTYPPLPEPSTSAAAAREDIQEPDTYGGIYSHDDIHALRQVEELTFQLWFMNEDPQLTVANRKHDVSITLPGGDTQKLLQQLSRESRMTLIEEAERTNNIEAFENRELDEVIKKIKWRWSQDPEAN